MSIAFENTAATFQGADTPIYAPAYRLDLAIIKEEDGSFSAIILNLPGAGSCGATEDEAVANAKEAATGVISSYLEEGKCIPWQAEYTVPEHASRKRELVQVNG